MLQVRDFVAVMGPRLKKIIVASTIAMLVAVSTVIVRISLIALARGSLTIDGSRAFQALEDLGVKANSVSWKNGEQRPALARFYAFAWSPNVNS
jgi:hypothetical protein